MGFLHKNINIKNILNKLSASLHYENHFDASNIINNIIFKLAEDPDDAGYSLTLRQELKSSGRLMDLEAMYNVFFKRHFDKGNNLVETTKNHSSDLLSGPNREKVQKIINLWKNLSLYLYGEFKSIGAKNKGMLEQVNRQLGMATGELMRSLSKDKENGPEFVTEVNTAMKDAYARATNDVRSAQRDESSFTDKTKAESSSVGNHFKNLKEYRRLTDPDKKSKITEDEKLNLMLFAAHNKNHNLVRGMGSIPYDDSLRDINPRSKWTLEKLSKQPGKQFRMIRAEAKKTMEKMNEVRSSKDSENTLVTRQEMLRDHIREKMNELAEDPNLMRRFHARIISRIGEDITAASDEALAQRSSRLKRLNEAYLQYERYFDGTAPSNQSQIESSLFAVERLSDRTTRDEGSGRFILMRLKTSQITKVNEATNAGRNISSILDELMSRTARNEKSEKRSAVREACDDLSRFKMAEEYILVLQGKITHRNSLLENERGSAEEDTIKKSIAELNLRINGVKRAIKTKDRGEYGSGDSLPTGIKLVDLEVNDQLNTWMSTPTALKSTTDPVFDERIYHKPKRFKGRIKDEGEGGDGRKRHKMSKSVYQDAIRPDSENNWWNEYSDKVRYARDYYNEYGYNPAEVMVSVVSPSYSVGSLYGLYKKHRLFEFDKKNEDGSQQKLSDLIKDENAAKLFLDKLKAVPGEGLEELGIFDNKDEKKNMEVAYNKWVALRGAAEINELTGGSGGGYRIGRTESGQPNSWPYFRPASYSASVPEDLLREGYRAALEAIASMVGYIGPIPKNLENAQYNFYLEALKIREATFKLGKEQAEREADFVLGDEAVSEEVLADVEYIEEEHEEEGIEEEDAEEDAEEDGSLELIDTTTSPQLQMFDAPLKDPDGQRRPVAPPTQISQRRPVAPPAQISQRRPVAPPAMSQPDPSGRISSVGDLEEGGEYSVWSKDGDELKELKRIVYDDSQSALMSILINQMYVYPSGITSQ